MTRQERVEYERQVVRALKRVLVDLGIDEPLTDDRIAHLRRLLPDEYKSLLRFRHPYELFGDTPRNQEPAWAREEPDPEVLAALRAAIPDAALARAWNDRWVTAATAAAELGISVERARQIMEQVGFIETKNPHYSSAAPMRLARLMDILDWASQHPEEVERWAGASRRAREAYRRRLRSRVEALRTTPNRIAAATSDPAPLVCFWLALLNRAAKDGHTELYALKDRALQSLIRTGTPCEVGYVEGGDLEPRVILCPDCRDRAWELGIHPADYAEFHRPCRNCTRLPGEARYYDLYELTFRFPGIGTFRFHVPYPIGKDYLPPPEAIPEERWSLRGEDGAWAFGRPLNTVERAAFSVDEIKTRLLAALELLEQHLRTEEHLCDQPEP